MYDLHLPEEPADGSVVLDREGKAWQRIDELAPADHPDRRWSRVAVVIATIFGPNPTAARVWRHLLVDLGPLAPMVAESAIGDYLERYDPVLKDDPAPGVEKPPLGCDSPSVTGEAATDEHPRPRVETGWGDSLGAIVPGYRPTVVRPVVDRPQA